MKQVVGSKIALSATNVSKCVCPTCPVQAKSQCVSDKLAGIGPALKMIPLNREDIPGVYCSSDTATCKDLNPKQPCMCGACAIYSEHKLSSGKPAAYFCKDGSAR